MPNFNTKTAPNQTMGAVLLIFPNRFHHIFIYAKKDKRKCNNNYYIN